MARHRSKQQSSKKTKDLPRLLVRLIRAAEANKSDAEHSANPDALRAFGALALTAIPAHGVFVPNQEEMMMAIERIAKKYLGFSKARHDFRKALLPIEPFDKRDAIASVDTSKPAINRQSKPAILAGRDG